LELVDLEVVSSSSEIIRVSVRHPDNVAAVQAKLRGLFVEPIPGTPEGIKKRGEAEAALWGSLIAS
jgi:hypothetical protein